MEDLREDVTVFWDFETTLPSGISSISTYDMVKNVHSALRQYGPLRWIRLYWDYSSYPTQSASMRIRAEFSASGVCLIDCPAEARPGAPMKKLLVDLILHAWDHSIRHTYVVITGDRDIAYGLAMLRMRNYRVVLISPPNSHVDLVSQATIHLNFPQTVLGIDGGFDDKVLPPDPWLPSTNPLPDYFNAQTSSRFGRNLSSDPLSHGRTPPLSKSYHGDSGIDDLLLTPSRTTGVPNPGDGLSRLRSTTLEATASRPIVPSGTTPWQHMSLEKHLEPLGPLELKGKEKDFPVLESDDFRSRSQARTNNSYFTTNFKAVESEPQPHEPLYTSSFPSGGMSRRASVVTASSSSTFSIIQNPGVLTVPTSAEQNKEDKFNNVPEASRASVTDQLSRRSSPKSQASPSAYEKILSTGSGSQAKEILVPETRIQRAEPVVEQKQIFAVAVLPPPKPILQSAPKPVMPKATSESKPTLASGKPSDLTMGPSSTLRTKTLPAGWVPLIDILRANGRKLPLDTLPAKLLKSSPNAYAKVGQKKYSKYIELAAESNIIMLLRDDRGHVFVHLSEEYT